MTTVNDHFLHTSSVLTTPLPAIDIEQDQPGIRAAMDFHRTNLSRRTWQTYIPSSAHKRLRIAGCEPPLTQTGSGIAFNHERSRSISTRVRRLIKGDDPLPLDPSTIPVLTKRQQKKAERREKRQQEEVEKKRLVDLEKTERAEKKKLDALVAYQRKEMHDRISRQLEVSARERQLQQPQVVKLSLKAKVKSKLKRSSNPPKNCAISSQALVLSPDQSQIPPHIDDFQNKNDLRSWFGPSDVEAQPPATTIGELPPAELPAIPASLPYRDFRADIAKRSYYDTFDTDTLPPPLPRSPSPCLSSTLPRRGITLSAIPSASDSKQMQCDYCHDAIKMTGFHYACIVCDDGDRLYCAKCTNEGRTCRHELIERTRNIKRHPTNAQSSERRSLFSENNLVASAETKSHAELSACKPDQVSLPLSCETEPSDCGQQPSASGTRQLGQNSGEHSLVSPVSLTQTDMYRELDAKRREQEVIFREKEVTLREREAMLREREAWTISREKDAAMMQQMQAAAMLQQCERAAEVGAQFGHASPVSRRASCCWASPAVSRHSSSKSTTDSITLQSVNQGRRPNVELVNAVAALEASVAGIELAEPILRVHGNSTKRKASAANSRSHSGTSVSKKTQNVQQSRQNSNKSTENNDMEDDSEEDEGSSKRQKQDQTPIQPGERLFACPYYKFDSQRYAEGNTEELHYRNCAGGLYRDISRVKQHLRRIHHEPDFYCQTCFEDFETKDDCTRHTRKTPRCDVKDCPWPERLDLQQQKQIHIKRPRKDPQEQWYEIFSIIFPGATPPDSAYIEPTQSKGASRETLDHFVQLFDNRLDSAVGTVDQPWLQSDSARHFLRLQMMQTVQDMFRNMSVGNDFLSTGVPSVMVSPVSPPSHHMSSQSHRSVRPSQSSSSADPRWQHCSTSQAPLLNPSSSCGRPLRPALKVTTGSIASSTNLNSGHSSEGSANSQQGHSMFSNICVPSHVQDDQGYDKSSDSWMSGDDKDAMSTIFPVQEPSSATSNSSRKVSFATPPSHLTSRSTSQRSHTSTRRPSENAPAPTFIDLMSYWSTQDTAGSGISHTHTELNPKHYGRADSAYGTMSHHPSASSLFRLNDMHLDMTTTGCIDPQMLVMNPAQHNYEGPYTLETGTETYGGFNTSNTGMNF